MDRERMLEMLKAVRYPEKRLRYSRLVTVFFSAVEHLTSFLMLRRVTLSIRR